MKRKILLAILLFLCLIPFGVTVVGSLRVEGRWSLAQYGQLLLQTPRFFEGFWNSFFYTALILLFNVPLSLAAAYGFSRFRFKGRFPLFWLYILMILLPFQATVVPQYLTLKALGLLGGVGSVIWPNLFATFGTFLMVQYMKNFDRTLYEAAEIDGMGSFSLFVRLVLPVCRPTAVAMAALSFFNFWSLVEQPLMFLDSPSQQPLSVMLSTGSLEGVAYAGGVVFSLLPLLCYLSLSREIQAGVAGGEEKPHIGKRRGRGKGWCIGFVAAMAFFTLMTQKVSGVMENQVAVYTLGRPAPVLPGREIVVPQSCVYQTGGKDVVYVLMPSHYDPQKLQTVEIPVEVIEEEKGYCALSAALERGQQLVCYASRPVTAGEEAVIRGEAFDD